MATKKSIEWVNDAIDKLYDFFSEEICVEEDGQTTDLFLALGGFLRAYGISLAGKTPEEMDEATDAAFDAIDDNIATVEELLYLFGYKLLSIGLLNNDDREETVTVEFEFVSQDEDEAEEDKEEEKATEEVVSEEEVQDESG
jgi:hypothetical protein